MKMMAALIVALLALAACGGAANNNKANANKPANDGHDHDSHAGTKFSLGTLNLEGGLTAMVTQIGEPKAGGETIFEVKLTKDDKDVADANVTGWLAGEDGKELAAAGTGKWEAEEKMYDVHTETPKELPAKVHFWLRVIASDGVESKGSLAVHKH